MDPATAWHLFITIIIITGTLSWIRQQRGTPDALFSLRRMMELAWQYEAPMHAAFVNFSKAFYLGYCGPYLGLVAWTLSWWT